MREVEKLAHFLESGDHSVFFYEDERDKFRVILPFFRAGLLLGDKCLFIGSKEDFAHIQKAILNVGDERIIQSLTESLDYFPDSMHLEAFRSGEVLSLCEQWETLAPQFLRQGYRAIRGVGVLSDDYEESLDEAIIKYEQAITPLFEKYPVSAICMYPRRLKSTPLGRAVNKLSCHPYRAQKLII